ncbi:MAG: hypothetical protein R3D78_10520 [Paracoccaceae bacterium]
MSYELLGASFDIHGGGIDLQFPHHENEIAQSCCAHPERNSPRSGCTMKCCRSRAENVKSLGNFFTVRDLLDQGIPGEVIRFVFLQTHYSKPMDWTAEKARQAEATLRKWRADRWCHQALPNRPELVAALADDLNTAGAIAVLHGLDDPAVLKASAAMLGLLEEGMGDWAAAPEVDLSALAGKLAALRETAMQTKDFAPVDALKSALMAAGVEVRMSKAGVELLPGPGFDATRLEGL